MRGPGTAGGFRGATWRTPRTREESMIRLQRHPCGVRSTMIAALLLCLTSVPALARPEGLVRIVTPVGAGGGSDAVLRIIADRLAKRWNQAVVVDNRPGADGLLAIADFIQAQGGHTLLFAWTGVVTANSLLHDKLPYDPVRGLLPISVAVDDFMAVAASPSLAASWLDDVVKLARDKPGALNYAAVPGAPYLSFLDFQKGAGIDLTFVPYRNPIASVTDLIEGRIQIAIMPLAVLLGQARAGKVKLLAVASDRRTPSMPEVSTVVDQAYPRFSITTAPAFLCPNDLDAALRERIAADVHVILSEPQVRERLADLGYVARGSSPAEYAHMLAEQAKKWAEIARAHGAPPSQ